jgi:hypothetical protein
MYATPATIYEFLSVNMLQTELYGLTTNNFQKFVYKV